MSAIKRIDVKQLFVEKNPQLAKFIPGFLFRYINHIMHIDEVNEIIEKYGELKDVEFAQQIVKHFNVHQQIIGLDKIPKEGRYIFASNHPLGGFDGMLLMCNVARAIGPVHFLVNDLLMKIPQFKGVFVPLNKHGANSRDAVQNIEKLYASDDQILIFPAGLASRRNHGTIRDPEWKKHFIQKAVQHQRDIIPVHISGGNSNFFYNFANLRKKLNIKWNIEMFFLPNETFHHKGKTFTLSFGKPIPYQTFDKTKSSKAWAEEVKKIVYTLPTES